MSGQMDCTKFKELLDVYLDSELDQEARTEMIRHADRCPECGERMESMTRLLTMCAELDEGLTVPLDCQASWRKAVWEEAARRRVPRMRAWMKGLAAVAAALTLLVGSTAAMRSAGLLGDASTPMTGVSAVYTQTSVGTVGGAAARKGEMDAGYAGRAYSPDDSMTMMAMESDGAMEDVADVPGQAEGSGQMQTAQTGGMVVLRSASREIDSTSFDTDSLNIEDLVNEYEGYFESSIVTGQPLEEDKTGGRVREMNVRVPSEQLSEFLTSLDAVGSVTYRSEEAQDISGDYYDAQARLNALKAQRDRLNQLVSEAQDVAEIIEIEDKLYEVQASIDALESRLRGWDSKASYSQVYVRLTEVAERDRLQPIDENLGARARSGFYKSLNWLKDFLQDMTVVLASVAPQLVLAIPLLVLVLIVVRVVRKKKK